MIAHASAADTVVVFSPAHSFDKSLRHPRSINSDSTEYDTMRIATVAQHAVFQGLEAGFADGFLTRFQRAIGPRSFAGVRMQQSKRVAVAMRPQHAEGFDVGKTPPHFILKVPSGVEISDHNNLRIRQVFRTIRDRSPASQPFSRSGLVGNMTPDEVEVGIAKAHFDRSSRHRVCLHGARNQRMPRSDKHGIAVSLKPLASQRLVTPPVLRQYSANLAGHVASKLAEHNDIRLAFDQFDGDQSHAAAATMQDVPREDFHRRGLMCDIQGGTPYLPL